MITDMQSRAARGLLRWTQADLARAAGVSQLTVRNFEAEKTSPTRATLDVIQRAFEKAGVEFNADGRGVRLKPPKAKGKPK
jgi:transcriptional regulator with XRE-family HTH domain